jgi:hypothetical protein
MINVPQITANLARMPDRSLQQYAQMHRDDPYIVALALAESNRRKQMRVGAHVGAAQQMPTVVEQDLAQMAPEQVGIGSLPEQSLAKMAGGGIVAFEEGGEVEHYQNRGFTKYETDEERDARERAEALLPPAKHRQPATRVTGSYGGVPEPETEEQLNARAQMDRNGLLTALKGTGAIVGDVSTLPLRTGIGGLQALGNTRFGRALGLNFTPPNALSAPWNVGMPMATAVFDSGEQTRQALLAQQQKEAEARQINRAAPPTGPGITPSSGSQAPMADVLRGSDAGLAATTAAAKDREPAAPAAPAAPPMTMQDALKQAQELIGGSQPGAAPGIKSLMSQLPKAYDPTADINAAKTELKSTFGDTEKFDREASLAERKKIGEDYYSKAQALIDKEEGKTKSDTEQAGFMALLEAGLGIMGGTSQHAMVNIGQGGKAAMANFSSAMKDIRKASRENEKMRLDLERLKAADARGDIDAVDRLEDSVKNRNANMKSHLASGLGAISAAGVNAKGHASSSEISAVASLLTNQLTNQTHLQTTGMQLQGSLAAKIFEANQPPAEIKSMQQYLANPELAKLREKFLTAATGLRGEDALRKEALKDWSNNLVLQQKFPKFEDYLASVSTGGIMAPKTSGATGASNQWGPSYVVKP